MKGGYLPYPSAGDPPMLPTFTIEPWLDPPLCTFCGLFWDSVFDANKAPKVTQKRPKSDPKDVQKRSRFLSAQKTKKVSKNDEI